MDRRNAFISISSHWSDVNFEVFFEWFARASPTHYVQAVISSWLATIQNSRFHPISWSRSCRLPWISILYNIAMILLVGALKPRMCAESVLVLNRKLTKKIKETHNLHGSVKSTYVHGRRRRYYYNQWIANFRLRPTFPSTSSRFPSKKINTKCFPCFPIPLFLYWRTLCTRVSLSIMLPGLLSHVWSIFSYSSIHKVTPIYRNNYTQRYRKYR